MHIPWSLPVAAAAILLSSAVAAGPALSAPAAPPAQPALTAVNQLPSKDIDAEVAASSDISGQSPAATAEPSPASPEPTASTEPEPAKPSADPEPSPAIEPSASPKPVPAESASPEPTPSTDPASAEPEHDHGEHEHPAVAGVPTPGHVDPAPSGVNPRAEVSDSSIIKNAGVDEDSAEPQTAAEQSPLGTGADQLGAVPPGEPGNSQLSAHVRPACVGTGTDGNRVQALYVYEQGQANRLDLEDPSTGTNLRAALQSYLGDVDDTFVLSSPQAPRRVRWVSNSSTCLPTIAALRVPAGALSAADSGLGSIRAAAEGAGLVAAAGEQVSAGRKLLAFADAERLCGIGQIYRDDRAVDNVNDSYYTMTARVDRGCWAMFPGWHSTAAHELMHMLGGVQRSAPNATSYGHCTDERDAMCYADGGTSAGGSLAKMRQICTAPGAEGLLDCNRDDYFNPGTPTSGSYLANYWNTANSSYLDVSQVDPQPQPPTARATITAPSYLRPGLPGSARVTSSVSGQIRWSASADSCLGSYRSGSTVAIQCPSYAPRTLSLSVSVTTADGRVLRDTRSLTLGGPAANLTVSLSAPSRVYVRTPAYLTASVRYGSTPVRAKISLQRYVKSGSSGYWGTVTSTLLSSSGTARLTAPSSYYSGARSYRVVVWAGSGSGWRATSSSSRTVWSVYGSVLYAAVVKGSPNTVWVRLRTHTGTMLGGRRVVLQSRNFGSSSWRSIAARTTNSGGWANVRTQPGRGTAYRWVYYGETRVTGRYSRQVGVWK